MNIRETIEQLAADLIRCVLYTVRDEFAAELTAAAGDAPRAPARRPGRPRKAPKPAAKRTTKAPAKRGKKAPKKAAKKAPKRAAKKAGKKKARKS